MLKLRIVEEYEQTDCSYLDLSKKYKIKYTTIASWIQKYKKRNFQPSEFVNNDLKETNLVGNFYDVTQAVKEKEIAFSSDKIILEVNGVEIKVNKEGLKTIIEVIKSC